MNLTRTGAVLGTPLYLSPEQCVGSDLDGRTDLYSLGATLFHLLTGRPPFVGDSPWLLIHQHCNEPPPPLQSLRSTLSDGTCRIVERALAKAPEHRQASAVDLLREIEDQLGGRPSNVEAHPLRPTSDPTKVLAYDFAWDLTASPADLWPHVSNTERLNQAIGLPAVTWKTWHDDGRQRRRGSIRKLGLEAAWEEHPFEWLEGRRFGVLRECVSGPFRWLLSTVELTPRAGGGTTLTHRLRAEPAGLIGRAFAAVELGVKTRRNLERVYRRIDAALRSQSRLADPFAEPASLGREPRRRLHDTLNAFAAAGVDPVVSEHLGAYLEVAPAQELARLRPLALARRLGLDADAVCAACLYAAKAGLLVLSWDLLCPLCRGPSQFQDSLQAVHDHAHCPACAEDYEVDFGHSVELVFRADPSFREAERGTFCIGGPAHSPHVVAQVRVAPGERLRLDLSLSEGVYRLRGPQLPAALELLVEAGAVADRHEVDLERMVGEARAALRPGHQTIELHNSTGRERVVRLERAAQREDALTAARAAAMTLFRDLFPGEVLADGKLIGISTVTLLATELTQGRATAQRDGEAKAFALLHAHLREVEGLAKRHGGALLKAVGDGAMAAFTEPAGAVRVATALTGAVRIAVYRGPALAATINGRLDYFGAAARRVADLLAAGSPGQRLIGSGLLDDPAVAGLVQGGAFRRVGGEEVLVM